MRRVALIALLAVGAGACTIDVDIGVSLNPDGSGSLVVDVAADEEFQTLFQLTGRDFEDLIATRGLETGLAFSVTPGAVTRYSAASSVVPAETLASILEGVAPGIGEITITADADALELDARLNPLTSIEDVAPYFVESDPGQFADDARVTVTVDMAGEIDASTATSARDGELTWTLPFSDSGTRMFARALLTGDGGRVPWTLAIFAGTLVLAVGFLIAIRSRLAETEETPQPFQPTPPAPKSVPPEDQPVAPESTPPEGQPVAPPAEAT